MYWMPVNCLAAILSFSKDRGIVLCGYAGFLKFAYAVFCPTLHIVYSYA
jgi:hypothetical protein